MAGITASVAVLTRFYGPLNLTDPWTPHLPVLWWLLFVLAVWSVLCEDMVFFLIAAVAGSFCVQTDIGYVGLFIGLGSVTIAACVHSASIRGWHG